MPAAAVGRAVAAEALCGETSRAEPCGRPGQHPPRSGPLPSTAPVFPTGVFPLPRRAFVPHKAGPALTLGAAGGPQQQRAQQQHSAQRPPRAPEQHPRRGGRGAAASPAAQLGSARRRGETCPGAPLPGKQPPGCASPPAPQQPPGPNAAAAAARPQQGKGRLPRGRAGAAGNLLQHRVLRPGPEHGDGCPVPRGCLA